MIRSVTITGPAGRCPPCYGFRLVPESIAVGFPVELQADGSSIYAQDGGWYRLQRVGGGPVELVLDPTGALSSSWTFEYSDDPCDDVSPSPGMARKFYGALSLPGQNFGVTPLVWDIPREAQARGLSIFVELSAGDMAGTVNGFLSQRADPSWPTWYRVITGDFSIGAGATDRWLLGNFGSCARQPTNQPPNYAGTSVNDPAPLADAYRVTVNNTLLVAGRTLRLGALYEF